ncbi:MAG: hypothetical protein WAM69_03895 [Candidatus Sulfotelmatobacter sp.]
MKRSIEFSMAVLTALMLLGVAKSTPAQETKPGLPTEVSEQAQTAPRHYPSSPGTLFVPKSSLPQTPPAGHRFAANTNVQVFLPHGLTPDEAPPFAGYAYETPASLACHYGLVTTTASPACNPNSTTVVPTGGKNTIAIVDAYDDPSAPGDLAWFSLQFGVPLTLPQFQVVWAETAASSCYGYGVPTDITGGWEVEESLDIEWSHAMAPSANIYLVEACSNYDSDLQQAVLVANNLVQCGKTEINSTTGVVGKCPTGSSGKGEVSMSWGGSEFVGEGAADGCATLDDSCFTGTGIVYFASTGDSPGVIWPGTSKNVVAAGGTTVRRNPSTGNFETEAAWVFGGGGQSELEARPTYQSSVSSIVGAWRGLPDLAFDADPYTGVWVYDTFPVEGYEYYEWLVVGGTSVASPSLAGIVNRAGGFSASTDAELTKIYANKAVAADFTDVTYGFCGFYMGFSVPAGWDFCTGVGVDKGYAGK